MHPVLFTLPIPTTQLRLLPALAILAVLGALLAGYARWRQVKGLVVFGSVVAAAAAFAAFALRAQTLELGPLVVPSWGTLFGLWLIVAWCVCQRAARRAGLDTGLAANGFLVAALSGLVLARGLFVVATVHEGPSLEPLALRQGGLLGIGGVLGCLVGTWVFFRRRSMSKWQWLDLNAMNLCLAVVMLRVGCYLHGCDFGPRLGADMPGWLRQLGSFPRWGDPELGPVKGSLPWVQQVQSGSLAIDQVLAEPVHPLQLYEVGFGLTLTLLAWYISERRSFHGQVALSVLLAYAVGSFVFEVAHADVPRGSLGPALELRVLLPFGLLLFAAAFAYGPALSMLRARQRYIGILLSLLPAGVAAVVTWHEERAVELSISQWLALVLAGAASYAWSLRHQVELGRVLPATRGNARDTARDSASAATAQASGSEEPRA